MRSVTTWILILFLWKANGSHLVEPVHGFVSKEACEKAGQTFAEYASNKDTRVEPGCVNPDWTWEAKAAGHLKYCLAGCVDGAALQRLACLERARAECRSYGLPERCAEDHFEGGVQAP